MSLSDWVTTTEVAAAAGVSRRTVQRWIDESRLPATQIGAGRTSAFLVARTDADAFLAARAGHPEQ